MEYENAKNFLEEMKEVSKDTRYRLIIAGNGRIIFQPVVSTSRKNVLLLRDFTPDDVVKIEQAVQKLSNITVKKVLNFFFDEKREPFTPNKH